MPMAAKAVVRKRKLWGKLDVGEPEFPQLSLMHEFPGHELSDGPRPAALAYASLRRHGRARSCGSMRFPNLSQTHFGPLALVRNLPLRTEHWSAGVMVDCRRWRRDVASLLGALSSN
jgi:hypothetical protein